MNQRPINRREKNTRRNPKIQRRCTHEKRSTKIGPRINERKTKPTQQNNDRGNQKTWGTTKRQNIQKGTETPKKKEQKDVQTHYKSRNGLPGCNFQLHGRLYLL